MVLAVGVMVQPWGFGHDLGGMMMGGGGGGLSAMPALRNEGLETFHPLSHSMQLGEDQVGTTLHHQRMSQARLKAHHAYEQGKQPHSEADLTCMVWLCWWVQEDLSDEDEGLARASRIRDEMMAGEGGHRMTGRQVSHSTGGSHDVHRCSDLCAGQKAGPWALGGTVEYEEGGGAARAGREEVRGPPAC